MESFSLKKKRMWIDAGRQMVKPVEPGGIGDRQIVAGAVYVTGSKKSPVLAFAVFFANPPPQIFRMNEFERLIGRSSFEFPRIDPISIALQHSRPLIHVPGEKARVARFVETPDRPPGSFSAQYIFRMAVGTASFAKLGFEYIENCGLRAV